MSEKHGVYVYEQDTAITAPIEATAGYPVAFGTAPIHRTASVNGKVGKLINAYRWKEMEAALGYDDDWQKWTLCEFMYTQSKVYGVSPSGFVNVFNPAKHFTVVLEQELAVVNGKIAIPEIDIIPASLIIDGSGGEVFTLDEDYSAARDDDGLLVVTSVSAALSAMVTVKATYNVADASLITAADIVSATEEVDSVYPRLGIVPGFLLAPGWSHIPEVGAALTAKTTNINNHFKAMAVKDIPTDAAPDYVEAMQWKSDNNYTSAQDIVCWPMCPLGEKIFHLSSCYVGKAIAVDNQYEDIPSVSASNKSGFQMAGACLADGTIVDLGPDQSELLNAAGIVTVFRMGQKGWRVWGNRTGVYPGATDPKDAFIPIRRMFNWIAATVTETFWDKVDFRLNQALIDNIVTSCNIMLAGWASRGHINGGRVIYDADENPVTDLMNGILTLHMYVTPPPPAQEIDFIMEFDTAYLSSLS